MKFNQLITLFIAFGLLLYSPLCGQQQSNSTGYKSVFGEKYTEAQQYLAREHWITDSLLAHSVDPKFALSIVFPELIRYSAIKDYIEINSLLTLYVQYGARYANFSVGRFQMKPTFAEQVETDAKQFLNDPIAINIPTTPTEENRLKRVKRLQSQAWQTRYLIWFIKIMDNKYPGKLQLPVYEKLRFYAAAYNGGYTNNEKLITEKMGRNLFHVAVFEPRDKYNYCNIAGEYFLSIK